MGADDRKLGEVIKNTIVFIGTCSLVSIYRTPYVALPC